MDYLIPLRFGGYLVYQDDINFNCVLDEDGNIFQLVFTTNS
ncbi:9975_t:CDS:1, partial [Gigaspora rosea]